MRRVLIVEDDNKISQYIENIVKSIDIPTKIFAFTNVKDAYHCMLHYKIDLFMIDIILDTGKPGDTSGLYLAEKIRMIRQYKYTPLIFITSLEDSKCISYSKFHCYSFIEKPFSPQYVAKMVKECLEFPEQINTEPKELFFRKDGIVLSVNREDIVYVECINHMLHIHTIQHDELSIPYITLTQFADMIDSDLFIRCRRNIIFHRKYLKNVDFTNGFLQLAKGYQVEIGLTYKNVLRKMLYD